MKKSILSLSAAVALGGLGFAGSANAWVAFDPSGTANALVDHSAGTGHMLFTPYYTANSGLATLVNIVNTDSKNGKAVKVRFRGATNSDDVLDFTLFLSPGDVWSGAVIQDPNTGVASLSTSDTSCTIPSADAWVGGVPFKEIRLPSYVTGDNLAALTREGYVEVLNMADIKGPSAPGANDASAMWKAVKHVNGVPPCNTLDYDNLLSTTVDVAAANSYGLVNPTGGLMGTWSILNLGDMGTFSGNQSALVATDFTLGNPFNGIYNAAPANMAFFPQLEANAGNVDAYTADPLLTGAPASVLTPLWFDLPDMSTPLTTTFTTPPDQALNLSLAFAKQSIMNEYVATAAGAAVPFNTDWVVSQPTRRYHAAVNYGTSAGTSAIVWSGAQSDNLYKDLTLDKTGSVYGPQACMMLTFASTDREEKAVKQVVSGGFSPGSTTPPKSYCGEVFVAQFGAASTLHAVITNRTVAPVGEAGWASLNYAGNNIGRNIGALPMVGYAATLFQNPGAGTTFGQTFPHRYTGSILPVPPAP